MYNYSSSEGRDVCVKGWKVAGILDATEKGLDGLQNLDPVHDIDHDIFVVFNEESDDE